MFVYACVGGRGEGRQTEKASLQEWRSRAQPNNSDCHHAQCHYSPGDARVASTLGDHQTAEPRGQLAELGRGGGEAR
jgi:hypothetical protein